MAKILVIDDYPDTIKVLESLLTLRGYEVVTAPNGREGVKRAFDHLPDLIVCDVMMPYMNGYEVLAAVRKNPATFGTPFILLTSRNEKEDVRTGMELGADDYLTKPFSNTEIVNAVKVRLEKNKNVKSFYDKKLKELQLYLLSSLPHELRTPLNTILGFAQIIDKSFDSLSKEEIKAMNGNILASGQDLLRMIGNYSYYNMLRDKMDSKAWRDNIEAISAKGLIEEVAFETSYGYKRTDDLKMGLADGELMMLEEHLRKLVKELSDNCFKFSQEDSRVSVKSFVKKGSYHIHFTDSGIGMLPDEVQRIGPFIQFNRDENEQQGSGLGLAIAKVIVKLYDGTFEIDSLPKKETIVKVAFPISK